MTLGHDVDIARRYDLDWLRFIAILILLFYHTGMLFNAWGWHIKNNEVSSSFSYWMVWLHFWRMPLLLFISGAGTFMALGKRSTGQFAGERFRRLFIPLLFGMFVIIPPQIYFEYVKQFDNYWDFYKTVFEFRPYPGGSFSWHHLWFILYLLCYSLLAIPLLIFLRSSRAEVFWKFSAKALSHPMGVLMIPSFILLTTQVALRPYFPEETHALINDWAYFTLYFCFFLFGILCYSNQTIWGSIGKNRFKLLTGAVIALVPFYVFYFYLNRVIYLPLSMEEAEIAFDVTAIFVSWFTVLAVISYGQHFLNRRHPLLQKITEGIYPFYILHQTLIIMIGFYICKLSWSITAKFWVVSVLTLMSCIFFYLFLIQPFNLMRFLFGMKPKKNKDIGLGLS